MKKFLSLLLALLICNKWFVDEDLAPSYYPS